MHSKDTPIIPEKSSGSAHSFASLLSASGAYLADKLYHFRKTTASGLSLQALEKIASSSIKLYQGRCLVVGREHYYETTKDYPIANKRDLQKALKFEQNNAPYDGIQFQHIEQISEQSHRVTFWVVNPESLTGLSIKPWLIFPESYLISLGLAEGIEVAEIPRVNNTLFISKTGKRLTSGLQSVNTPNLQNFCFSTGSALTAQNSQIFSAQHNDLSALIYQGLKSLPLSQWQAFTLKKQSKGANQFPWKAASILSGLLLTLYLTISSVYLVYQEQQLQQQLQAQTQQVNEALSLQKKYNKEKQWQAQLVTPLQQSTAHWQVWPIALDAIKVGAKVQTILYKHGVFRVNGQTDKGVKATDVLAKLSENPNVELPKFASPVRARHGQEKFAITFALKSPINSADEVNNGSKK